MHMTAHDCNGHTLGSTHDSCMSGLYFSRDAAAFSCMHSEGVRSLSTAAEQGNAA